MADRRQVWYTSGNTSISLNKGNDSVRDGGAPWTSPQLIAGPTWKDTQPVTLKFIHEIIHQSS